MKAPLKTHVKPIGAKWLRTGMNSGGWSSEFQFQSGGAVSNSDPLVTPQNQETVKKDDNNGDNNFQKSQMSGNMGIRNASNSCAINQPTNQRKEQIIIEEEKMPR